jgi:hypothetical protein
MNEEYNPFTDCEAYVSEHGTGAGVRSKYWNIPMPNEGVAKRVAELIQFAYYRGVSDNQDVIKKGLGISREP